MKCPYCREEMKQYNIPLINVSEAVYQMCENKDCVWFGIKREDIK